MATDTATAPPEPAKARTTKRAKKPKDPTRAPMKRERSALTRAVAALERAEKRRPALAAKLAGLEAAKANLGKLDDEIVELRADVVRIMNGGAAAAAETAEKTT